MRAIRNEQGFALTIERERVWGRPIQVRLLCVDPRRVNNLTGFRGKDRESVAVGVGTNDVFAVRRKYQVAWAESNQALFRYSCCKVNDGDRSFVGNMSDGVNANLGPPASRACQVFCARDPSSPITNVCFLAMQHDVVRGEADGDLAFDFAVCDVHFDQVA